MKIDNSLTEILEKSNSRLSKLNWFHVKKADKGTTKELTKLLNNGDIHISGCIDCSPKSIIKASYKGLPYLIEVYASLNDIDLGIQDFSSINVYSEAWKKGEYNIPKNSGTKTTYFPMLDKQGKPPKSLINYINKLTE